LDFSAQSLRVTSREGKHREFKEGFNAVDFPKYTKSMAAFGNTDGGILIFGVADKPRRILGIDAEDVPDEAVWADHLRRDFDPEISFEIREYKVGDKVLVAVATPPHLYRPIICRRNATIQVRKANGKVQDKQLLQEGFIYFRYTAQVAPIRYPELQALLRERDDRRFRAMMENLQIMEKVGADRVGIVDASRTDQAGANTKLYVSREAAKSLNFVDRGRFVEEDDEASPAYVVAGTVQLNEVMVQPLPEEDKNLPKETAERLKPLVEDIFGPGTPFSAHHVSKVARHLGMRSDDGADGRYCHEEKKLKRTYYTRDGINHMAEQLRANPLDCIRAFGAKATIQNYEERMDAADGQ